MRKTTQLFLLAVAFLFSTAMIAQSTVTGTVMASDLGAPLPGANVLEKGTSNGVSTDFDGNFTLTTEAASGQVVISFVGYGAKTISFNGDTNLGTITLSPDNTLQEVVLVGSGVIDLAEDRQTPIAVSTIKKQEIQERAIGNVEVTEIMKNTPSTYVSGQTGFGDSQIFMRGFDQINIATLLNGQPVNGMEDGRVYWSNWAGIADIANGVQVQRGLGSSKLAISSVGGTINLVMKSTDRTKGGFVRFMGGNDSYFKGTASYDTGLSEKGWSFSMLLDYWQAHRKWAEGTYGQGQTYFFSVGYKPNENHAFNLLLTGAPQLHGQRWSQSRETIENDSKFNQHWGYTGSFDSSLGRYTTDIESERQNYYHKPVLNLNWDWDISEKSDLSTVLYASWGRGGGTGDRGRGRIRTDDGQMDYYAIEQQALADDNGIGNEDGESNTSYIRRSSVNNHQWYGLVTNFSTDFTDKISFNVGADVRLYTGDHFRQVTDFYGLEGWANDRPDGSVVTDAFDATPWASLFNFADEDQRIDYDYSEDINYQGLFSQIEYAGDRFSAYFQGAISNQSYQREGRFDDPGKSEKLNKFGYNIKGGLAFEIADHSTIFGNAGYYSRQPFLDNIFKDIRSSNELFKNPEVDNEEITGIELGYNFQTGDFRASFNFYYTDWANRTVGDFDIDDNGTPDDDSDDIELNIFDRNLRQVHRGAELDMQYRVSNNFSLTGYISGGSWEKKGTITRDTFNDDTGELISSESGLNVDGVKITTAPQFTAGLGARATVIDGLTLYGNINYYANHYLNNERNPGENLGRIKPFSLTDVGASYNFDLGGDELTFNANVYNIFDEVRVQASDRFGFFNTNGMTFNASIKYIF